MKVIFIWKFEDGAEYHEPEELDDDDSPQFGKWDAPFPNVEGNCFAYGHEECFSQGDVGPVLIDRHGAVVSLECKEWKS